MITAKDIRVGMLLKVNPGSMSHSNIPYTVEVISMDSKGFNTKLCGQAPDTGVKSHERRFNYYSKEWIEYHQKRFEIL